jgi:hypothetical protein
LIAIIPEFQVDIEVNEVPVTIHMKLDDNGAAYFVELIDSDEEDEEMSPEYLHVVPSSRCPIFTLSNFTLSNFTLASRCTTYCILEYQVQSTSTENVGFRKEARCSAVLATAKFQAAKLQTGSKDPTLSLV